MQFILHLCLYLYVHMVIKCGEKLQISFLVMYTFYLLYDYLVHDKHKCFGNFGLKTGVLPLNYTATLMFGAYAGLEP